MSATIPDTEANTLTGPVCGLLLPDFIEHALEVFDGDGNGLVAIVDAAIASDPDAAAKVKEGNMKAIGPLVGFVMRETKGRADGGEVTRLIRERVGA